MNNTRGGIFSTLNPAQQQEVLDPMTGMPVQQTAVPPAPSNTLGMAKPVFNDMTQTAAQGLYGDVEQRQMSMGNRTPMFMKDQTGDGKITRADVIKARVEGYKE
jgi:hypothetical protein